MQFVVLGLGSNRKFNNMSCLEILKAACVELSSLLQTPVFSSVYKTKAMYVEDQEDFYNMVAGGFVADEKNPFELLKEINCIEAKYGRCRSEEIRFGPRSLDIDIEIFGNQNIRTKELTVPHERIKEREFVLVPLVEILENSADIKMKEEFQNYLNSLQKNKSAADDNIQKLGSYEAVFYGTGRK